jgi:diguanylate cyclase (GGDEF)-like protein
MRALTARPFRAVDTPAYCGMALALSVVYFMLAGRQDAQHVVYQAFGVIGVAGVAVGIRRHRPLGPVWPLVLAGLVLWVAGDTYWNVHRLLTGREAAFPSPADALYLLAYMPLLAAMVIMVRGGRPRAADVVDAGMVGLAASLIVWFAAILPATSVHQSLLSAVISDAYPTMDWLLLLALCQLLLTRSRTPALNWLVASFGVVLVTDVAYAWLRSSNSFTTSSWINAGYFWFYVLLGAAAMSPTMSTLTGASSTTKRQSGRLTPSRLALLTGALVASPVAILLQSESHDATRIVLLACVAAAISLLVLVRLALLFLEREEIDVKRRHAEAALERMAYRDSLTGLANRAALLSAIEKQIHETAHDRSFALLFVDLDGFKGVNDAHGHVVGDAVLSTAARRLRDAVRTADLVARHGGDEFIVLLRDLPSTSDAVIRATVQRVIDAMESPVELGIEHGPNAVRLGASVGVSVFPADGATTDTLIRMADQRMYEQKATGGDRREAA